MPKSRIGLDQQKLKKEEKILKQDEKKLKRGEKKVAKELSDVIKKARKEEPDSKIESLIKAAERLMLTQGQDGQTDVVSGPFNFSTVVDTAATGLGDDDDNDKEGLALDLVSFCLRAVGEWQVLDSFQCHLLNVETNVPIMQPDGNLKLEIEVPSGTDKIKQQGSTIPLTGISPKFIESLTCTKLTVAEMYKHAGKTDAEELTLDVVEIQNLNSWFDSVYETPQTVENAWMEPYKKADVLKGLDKSEIEQFYWAVKFHHRDTTIVAAILQTVVHLRQVMGYKYWILPNGEKVPLDAMKLGVIEVIPHEKYLVRCLRFRQTQEVSDNGDCCSPEVEPYPVDADNTKNIPILGIDAEFGPIYSHFILEVPLRNGQTYIVDPTSMQFNYRGPKKTIIVHGEWTDYCKQFPGFIIERLTKHEDAAKDLALQNYFRHQAILLGNGGLKLVDRLKGNLIKYFSYRTCNYCGQVEKLHEEDEQQEFNYKFINVQLMCCAQCRGVAYCNKICQKLDWKNHKAHCKKK
ncbi:uncharacterized protein LOC110847325 [Folsomia candida]|nr:uncharacterized protein LOC110847325 [Folsomia candida]XP_021949946.1 uncharacterized protein LOC110847325 [Folsomia candida]